MSTTSASIAVPDHAPTSTSSRLTRAIGTLAGLGALLVAYLALVATPPEVTQGDSVRIMYIHVPAAFMMFTGCGLATLASVMWLRRRTDGWDTLAHAAAEVALLCSALTLVTGMVWGRPTWGAYWTWDARLTSTTLLCLLLVGYLTVRGLPGPAEARSRRAAVVGLLLVPNAVVVHYSVDWWNTLHQDATISRLDVQIDGLMLFTLMLGIAVGTLVFGWLLVHRFRLAWLERQLDTESLDVAIEARRAEAAAVTPPVASTFEVRS